MKIYKLTDIPRNKPWCLDRYVDGKRKRDFFATKTEATGQAELEGELEARAGKYWLALTPEDRADLVSVVSEIVKAGFTVRDVWETFKRSGDNELRPKRTLAQVIEETLTAKTSAKRDAGYVKTLKDYYRAFGKDREHRQISSFTPAEIDQWFASRNEGDTTRASNLGRLSALFSLAERRGYIASNPCKKVERVTLKPKTPKIYTVDQCRALLDTCLETDLAFLPMLVLGMFEGLRPEAENEELDASDIDIARARVTIHRGKGGRGRRIVHIEPVTVAWLKLCKLSGLIAPKQIKRRRQRLAARSGVPWYQDSLRKTAASHLMEKLKDETEVALRLGTSPKKLFANYREMVTPEDNERFYLLFPFGALCDLETRNIFVNPDADTVRESVPANARASETHSRPIQPRQ